MNPFSVYKNYPFVIPARVRFFNLIRFCFKLNFLEKFLIRKLSADKKWWKKFIPPVYFYNTGEYRIAVRNSITYQLDLSSLLDHSVYFYTLNEPAWNNIFKFIKADCVVLDVGANIGFLTLNFAQRCPNGFVFAFEPDSINFRRLKKNVDLNDLANIKALNMALGANNEERFLYRLYRNNPGANRILNCDPSSQTASERVQVNRLDDVALALNLNRLDVVKIDVEGFEVFAIQGAEKTFAKYRPILFVELAEKNLREQGFTASFLVQYIESLNYEIRDATTMNFPDLSLSNVHTDIICFPR
jgi:FkbM family methyltransferase